MPARRPPIEPREYQMKRTSKRLAVFDSETDPFLYGREPRPFTCGFYRPDDGFYIDFWGDDCIDQFCDWLSEQEETYLIYAHNGGNFDFHFMLDWMDKDKSPLIINGRLVKIDVCGQEFRDSYSIIPVALGSYQKTEINYDKFERECRNDFADEIRAYQKDDCIYLSELVVEFHEMFGDRITMASVALPMLRSFHGFDTVSEQIDAWMRPYFFGGRNQCFKTGVLKPKKGKWFIYDRNSMYPTAMRDFRHPVSREPIFSRKIKRNSLFAKVSGRNYGALCSRSPGGGLDFTVERGTFYATIHELEAAEDLGLFKIEEVHEAISYEETTTFGEFVDHFYNLRLEASARKDEVRKLFYKLVLNSSYGKFAMNPEKFEDCFFGIAGHAPKGEPHYAPEEQKDDQGNLTHSPDGWFPKWIRGDCVFWSKPNPRRMGRFLNVATAASITGAARADLLRAIAGADNPIYCDTDSVICEGLSGVLLDDKVLGGWKTEAEGDVACIGGKKLYAVFNEGEEVKRASKGVRLTAEQIKAVCEGARVEYENPVPKFQIDGGLEWTTRTIERTG